ncbi:MAG: FMN-binding protein [Gammaproteobacteria bacterium]|nr:FMN-binding protein [Gammaproteobacteria bacterium]MCP4088341.1 FMN-binding protein [Gammaproteobacteria bacterium]MCP4275447.1 FMN-binding protein [Gammaproteobacteria bacterium]MCP4830995.1 FMN-binding protein [Gammaproteobacteria bacterium]MCP4927484.1 FMN-binding protein [Gammaproteobacteria bacterium]
MGLVITRKRDRLTTVAILAVILLLDLAWPAPDRERQITQSLLGADGERIELKTGPAFRVGSRWLLFFDHPGKVGPIRGAVLVEDDNIHSLHLFEAHEGINRDAFADPTLVQSLAGLPAKAPVEIDVITGATISSQMLADAVNETLVQWRSTVR